MLGVSEKKTKRTKKASTRRPVARKARVVRANVKRERSPVAKVTKKARKISTDIDVYYPSSDEAEEIKKEEEADEDEDGMTFLRFALKNNVIDFNAVEEQKVEIGPPPRPKRIKFPSDIDAKIASIQGSLARLEATIVMKEDNKNVSLTTSKVNYIDPRIVCSWAAKYDVPISRVFSQTLQKKFPWAMGEDFVF